MKSPTPREALITLNLIPGLGSVRIQSLLEFFGSVELALAAPVSLLEQVPKLGQKLAATVADWRNCTNTEAEMETAEQYGVRIVTLLDDDYPQVLRNMADPPIVLYVRGEWLPQDATRAVAVVGSRLASPYGMTQARRFAQELAENGCTIISGLARGVDTAAHQGALDVGGRTIAIIGSGMANIFPHENLALAERIERGQGAVVSEFPMFMRPGRTTFPQRNRIVAAWSQATLVVEAPSRSGSLITARMAAAEYGRTVFALPGQVDRPSSIGCHNLIREGAILCTSPAELMRDMDWIDTPRQLDFNFEPTPPAANVSSIENEVLAAITAGHNTLDALCPALGMPAHELTSLLMRMQVKRLISPLPGGRFK